MPAELPQSLLRFIQLCIPTFQAAEVLLFLAAHPDREFSPEEVVVSMRPVTITVPAVKEYIAILRVVGPDCRVRRTRYRYGPQSVDLEHRVGELARAYNERPVTLIGAIYRIADDRIRSFADSFKLKTE